MRVITKLTGIVVGGFGAAAAVLFQTDTKTLTKSNKRYSAAAASIEPETKSKWEPDWDRRSGDNTKAIRNIILIRHGQYNLSGETDDERYLTSLGKEQAILTGLRLKELGLEKKITRFVESTMLRAHETSELVYKQLDNKEIPIETSDLLREGAPIEPDPPISHWNPDPKSFYVDGGRIESAFRHYIHRAEVEQQTDSFEVYVCHANVIRYFVCRALQLPPDAWLRFSLRHGSISWITIRPNGRVSLKCLGDAGHMPSEKLTFN